jgi:hypothetical protein
MEEKVLARAGCFILFLALGLYPTNIPIFHNP